MQYTARQTDNHVRRRTLAARLRVDLTGWAFLAPFLAAYGLFVLWPMIDGLRISFYNWSLLGTSHFVGLENYSNALKDSLFWTDVGHTLKFTVESTIPLVVLGFIMAMLANQKLPAQWLFRLAFFAPYVLPVSIMYLIWNWLFSADYGLLNSWLSTLGLPTLGWLTDEGVAMTSIVIATIWWTVGFNFVLYLAGLQDIPQELYDAAMIDGAGPWAVLRTITIPLLQRTTTLIVVLQVLASLKLFDQSYLLGNYNGGPNGSTQSAIEYIYQTGFVSYRLGYAAAMSYLFFLVILVIAVVQFVVLNRGRVES